MRPRKCLCRFSVIIDSDSSHVFKRTTQLSKTLLSSFKVVSRFLLMTQTYPLPSGRYVSLFRQFFARWKMEARAIWRKFFERTFRRTRCNTEDSAEEKLRAQIPLIPPPPPSPLYIPNSHSVIMRDRYPRFWFEGRICRRSAVMIIIICDV